MLKEIKSIFSIANDPVSEEDLSILLEYLSPSKVPESLIKRLSVFNGACNEDGVEIYSSEQIVDEHKRFIKLFESAKLIYPNSLIPFYGYDKIVLFVKAENSQGDNEFVWSFCAGDGDTEIYI